MIAGVILAGGKSSRMGCDKSQLMISGLKMIEKVKIPLKQSGISDIFISGKQGIQDDFIEKGPLAGIMASLIHLKDFDHVLFSTVDMPLINESVIQDLINNRNSRAVLIGDYFFPMLLCNSETNRTIITKQLNNGILSVNKMLKKIDASSLINQHPDNLFLNANTQDDWKKIIETVKRESD